MGKGTNWMSACRLCPRECGADRTKRAGRCGAETQLLIARASLHMWEEPCLSGTRGSGTIFFAGCSLGCIYCQNAAISGGRTGIPTTPERMAQICLELQEQGAHNINLVTAGHFVPLAAEGLAAAKQQGLRIPVVYNSSGYEKADTLRLMDGLVDIYLPDFKYADPATAAAFSRAPDYPEIAKAALEEMVRQVRGGTDACEDFLQYDRDGLMTRGVIVRHLLLPGHVKEAERIVRYLYDTYGDTVCISLMRQYTPMPAVQDHPQLRRKVTEREYEKLVEYALSLGLVNGFVQEGEAVGESFIPSFQGEGVLRSSSQSVSGNGE